MTRSSSILFFSVMGLISVPHTANSGVPAHSPSSLHCLNGNSSADAVNVKRFAGRSVPFRKAAEEAWRATQNGDAPFEAGFSINNDGRPGKVQLSLFSTSNAATHLVIASNASALGTLHVHNRFGESTPSTEDIDSAKSLRKTVFVESRTGLYSINPNGQVSHVFPEPDWFTKRCANGN
jgi:hypothetical protein